MSTPKYYAVDTNFASPTQEKAIIITENGTIEVLPDEGYTLAKVGITTQMDEGEAIPEAIIIVDENGNEYTAVLTDEAIELTATAEDIRAGETAITNNGIDTGTLVTPIEQEKTVEITENGTVEILPDEGHTLSKVTATALVGIDDSLTSFIEGTMTELYDPKATSIVSNFIGVTSSSYKTVLAKNLTSVNLPNVVTVGANAFYNCTSLASIDLPKVEKIDYAAFKFCSSLCGDLCFYNLTDLGRDSFYGTAIKSFSAPNYEASISKADIFTNCTELEWVSFPKAASLTTSYIIFKGCTSLKRVSFPNGYIANGWSQFSTCTSLKIVDLKSVSASTTASMKLPTASDSTSIRIIVLRDADAYALSSIPTTGVFAEGGEGGYIIVSGALISSYKSDPIWHDIMMAGSCVFLPLEEYTTDGTTVGELDWDKLEALIEDPEPESGGIEE